MTELRAKLLTLLGPTLTLGLLAAGAYVQRDWPQPADAAPYHARARTAIEHVPVLIGPWVGRDLTPQPAAIEVLKPNAIRNIELIDTRPRALGKAEQHVSLSIVQCKRFDDMLGHSPPACYPAFGDRMVASTPRQWDVQTSMPLESLEQSAGADPAAPRLRINGTEYQFERVIDGRTYRRIVYNFMIAPRQGILPDMESLRQAAEDYRQRYFGAAQFQVVFDSLAGQELAAGDRDEIFQTLMRAASPAIRVLLDEPTPAAPSVASTLTPPSSPETSAATPLTTIGSTAGDPSR